MKYFYIKNPLAFSGVLIKLFVPVIRWNATIQLQTKHSTRLRVNYWQLRLKFASSRLEIFLILRDNNQHITIQFFVLPECCVSPSFAQCEVESHSSSNLYKDNNILKINKNLHSCFQDKSKMISFFSSCLVLPTFLLTFLTIVEIN